MNAFRIIRPIVRNLRDYGLAATLAKVGSYLVKPFYENRTYRIYCIDLDQLHIPPETDPDSYRYTLVTAEDTSFIRQIEDLAEWFQGQIASKLRSDHLCLAVLDGETVAAFNLVAFSKADIPLLQWERPLDPEEAWSEQITVNRSYRRKGLGRKLRYQMFRELRNIGKKRFCGGALVSNTASLRLARGSGFREVEDIQFKKILWQKSWLHHEVNP